MGSSRLLVDRLLSVGVPPLTVGLGTGLLPTGRAAGEATLYVRSEDTVESVLVAAIGCPDDVVRRARRSRMEDAISSWNLSAARSAVTAVTPALSNPDVSRTPPPGYAGVRDAPLTALTLRATDGPPPLLLLLFVSWRQDLSGGSRITVSPRRSDPDKECDETGLPRASSRRS